ncbi:probable palmitoyltransferase ZDHHC24 [Drosophila biarmipes]|uniref:probable palmitoyltransferase ZDHHC24 n=1 Tax=Drosophila biarmipes TaxID=125945 RepID=UPI0007E6151A|nr:probable palmitoyltransferase ZDHHC24 [Drosophila biarmipes]
MCFIMVGCKYVADIYPVQFVKTAHPLSVGLVLVGTAFFLSVEMFLIVPMIFDTGGVMYKLAWLVAVFIVYNVLGNMLACYRTDTSVASLPRDRQVPEPEEEHLWHHCDYCQTLVPPRSWHCRLCNCCILRRDHHCIFTATCVGHNNYRYFFWFIIYLTAGTFLALASHVLLFLINKEMRRHYMLFHITNAFSFVEPTRKFDLTFVWINLIFVLNAYAFTFSLVMVAYQIPTIYLNTTFYTQRDSQYNRGLRENFGTFMGSRGVWTFLSPTIRSPLPHDGTQWETRKPSATICEC